jgi:hypothetical protein
MWQVEKIEICKFLNFKKKQFSVALEWGRRFVDI